VLPFSLKILFLPPYWEVRWDPKSDPDPEPDPDPYPKFPEKSDPDRDPKKNNFGSTTLSNKLLIFCWTFPLDRSCL